MKKYLSVIPLVLLVCFVVGCQDKVAIENLEEFKAQADIEEQNKETVKRYFELMDEGNPAFLELLSEDYIAHFPGGVDFTGREEIKKMVDSYFIAFPDLTHFFSDFMAEGDMVAMRYGDNGTHKGDFMGIPPTEKGMTATSMGFFRLKEGKMVEAWIEGDFLGMMQQLGMELKPKEAGK